MRRSTSGLAFSATDLSNHLACAHLSLLNRSLALGERAAPRTFDDPGAEALRQRGLEHESRVLASFTDRGLTVEEIPNRDEEDGDYETGFREGAARTVDAMRRGVDVIYQGRLYDGRWSGYPDFLLRVDATSDLGDWSYEVVDAKLSREAKCGAVLQTSLYSDLLKHMQGHTPEHMHLALGRSTGELETFRVDEYSAYYRATRARFEALIADRAAATYPEPVEHCQVCRWSRECADRRRRDDHLSLVAGIARSQRTRLVERDVETLTGLAAADMPLDPPLDGVSDASYTRIREQARVQLRGRELGEPYHELLEPIVEGEGLASLPEPSPGDLFFDIEGAAYALEDGLEYLFGFTDAAGEYTGIWALNRVREKEVFERFMDLVMDRLEQFPDMHVYHYAPYEKTAIKALAGRHATKEDEVDRLLRGEVLVDLYRAVRQGVRASVESYSIKKMEPFYGFERDVDLVAANRSLATFEAWLELGGTASDEARELRDVVEGYNRDDCVSTLRLRDWLESLRTTAEAEPGTPIPRPPQPDDQPGEEVNEIGEEVAEVYARLLRGVPEAEEDRDAEDAARWLLAHLLEFHRREDKSMWWEYFTRCDMSADELIEDRSTLGGLEQVGERERVNQSYVRVLAFPEQEHDLDVGDSPHDPATKATAGRVIEIDEHNNTISLIRGIRFEVPRPDALVPIDNIRDGVLRDSLLRLGDAIAATGFDEAGSRQCAADLLFRRRPRAGQQPGDPLLDGDGDLLEDARRLALALDRTTLPVQGPPGSGKTYTGARMITALLAAGKRVGITSNSHKVISNLLTAVCEAADEEGVTVRGVQKANERQWCKDTRIPHGDNAAVVEALAEGHANLAAGTAWLWSREDMAESVDVLFIDEAGQVSLANTLAVSPGGGRASSCSAIPSSSPSPSRASTRPARASPRSGTCSRAKTRCPRIAGCSSTTPGGCTQTSASSRPSSSTSRSSDRARTSSRKSSTARGRWPAAGSGSSPSTTPAT